MLIRLKIAIWVSNIRCGYTMCDRFSQGEITVGKFPWICQKNKRITRDSFQGVSMG